MASLLKRLTTSTGSSRSDLPMNFQDWVGLMYNGLQYQLPSSGGGSLSQDRENITSSFQGYVDGAYKSNGVVFACMAARLFLFSEARFQFQRMREGRPGKMYGKPELGILEKPWNGGTTGDLLGRMIQHADLAGNAYVLRRRNALRLLRPDWVTIILGSRTGSEVDNELIGYSYKPGGPGSDEKPIGLLPEEVAHFAPNPDPGARFRGMSWLTPVVNEILADGAATQHKLSYFQNGATPNRVVTLDAAITQEKFEAWIATFENSFKGAVDAYKTLYLGGGADVTVVGNDMKQIDFKVTQGHGETRIAAAAGSPPIYVGLSEGLEAATYSNYGQAVRRFADGTIRPLWRNAAGSLAQIIAVPSDSRLWYDDRDIPALQEDMKDEAEIQATQASAISTLIMAGYEPDSVVESVTSGDLTRLVHTNLFSVQLHPPGTTPPALPNGSSAKALPAPAP
jgi:HK97 family phage portal protein